MPPRYQGQAAATLRNRAQNLDPNSAQYQNIRQRLQGIREKRQAVNTLPVPPQGAQQNMRYDQPQQFDQYGNQQSMPYGNDIVRPPDGTIPPPNQDPGAGMPAPTGPIPGGGYTGYANDMMYPPGPSGASGMDSLAQDAAAQGYQPPGGPTGPMQPPMLPPPPPAPPIPAAANYTGVASVLRNQMQGVNPNSQRGQYLRGRLQNVRNIRKQYPGGNY